VLMTFNVPVVVGFIRPKSNGWTRTIHRVVTTFGFHDVIMIFRCNEHALTRTSLSMPARACDACQPKTDKALVFEKEEIVDELIKWIECALVPLSPLDTILCIPSSFP
jgi:hypothetical protein